MKKKIRNMIAIRCVKCQGKGNTFWSGVCTWCSGIGTVKVEAKYLQEVVAKRLKKSRAK